MEFDPFSDDFHDDPYNTYRWLRDEAPVYRSDRYGFWALSRYDDVVMALRDWRTFTSSHGITVDQLVDPILPEGLKGLIIFMDPPEHDRMRKLVSRVFTPRAVADLEPLVRDVVTRYLDPLASRSHFDLCADFSAPFPVEVIAEMLGIPRADRQQIRHWLDVMLHREPGVPQMTHEGMEAAINSWLYLLELTKQKRRHPTDDMLSRLAEAEVDDDDGRTHRLTDEEIAGFASLLGGAGAETVTKLVGSGVVLFHRNPDQWRKVLDDRAALPGAVEEILRYWAPSQYQGRFTNGAITLHGVTIPQGEPVLLLTGSASRDGRAYADPDRFDIDRRAQLPVGFGHGIHACLGAALARLESRIAFEEIAARWPEYTVDEGGLRRVKMSNVAGYCNVPVEVPSDALARA